jgi:beta-glucosidase
MLCIPIPLMQDGNFHIYLPIAFFRKHLLTKTLQFSKRSNWNSSSLQTSPPFYPSPWMDGSGDWADAYAKAKAFVSQLTLLEKVNLTTGIGWEGEACVGNSGSVPRLGFRAFCMQDSPLGIRFCKYLQNS